MSSFFYVGDYLRQAGGFTRTQVPGPLLAGVLPLVGRIPETGSDSRGRERHWRAIPSLGFAGPGKENTGPGKAREEQFCFLAGELHLFLWAVGPWRVHLCVRAGDEHTHARG